MVVLSNEDFLSFLLKLDLLFFLKNLLLISADAHGSKDTGSMSYKYRVPQRGPLRACQDLQDEAVCLLRLATARVTASLECVSSGVLCVHKRHHALINKPLLNQPQSVTLQPFWYFRERLTCTNALTLRLFNLCFIAPYQVAITQNTAKLVENSFFLHSLFMVLPIPQFPRELSFFFLRWNCSAGWIGSLTDVATCSAALTACET